MASLPVVYGGVRQPTMDIVSIPGLPDLIPQYRVKDHNIWLRDVLSHHIPHARIMSFHYDFAKPSTVASWKDLIDQVLRFLYALAHRREESEQLGRPLVFICYSFGSIILKKALLIAMQESQFRQIFENTRGILFLGCLHNEQHQSFEDLSLRCAAIEFRTTTKKHSIIDTLRTDDWPALKEVLESFRDLKPAIHVRSFCETRPTVYQSNRLFTGSKTDLVCPPEVAVLGWPNEAVLPVDLDHVQLSIFPNRMHQFFETFMQNLRMLTEPLRTQETGLVQASTGDDSEANDAVYVTLDTGTTLRQPISEASAPSSTALITMQAVKLPCFVVTPHKENPDFVGRQDIATEIHHAFKAPKANSDDDQRTYAICGLGGMGKTSIAVDYVFRHRNDYQAILWAHGENETKLVDSFSRFVAELGLSVPKADQIKAVQQWLCETDASWLLVMDNVDSEDKQKLLQDFLPTANHGSILITSRDSSLLGQCDGVELSALDTTSAVDLFLKLSHFSRGRMNDQAFAEQMTAAKKIVNRIGCLPIGINHAANLIINERCRMTEFLEIYDNEDLIKETESLQLIRSRTQDYPHSLSTVWNMNFTRLTTDQQSLLNIMAFCDPDRFQLRILSKAGAKGSGPELHFISNPKKIHKCKLGLLRSSLVHENEDISQESDNRMSEDNQRSSETSREIGMHRLVQATCHLRMGPEDRKQYFKWAIALVISVWPVPARHAVYDPLLWPEYNALLPHVQRLCRYYVKSCEEGDVLLQGDVNWNWPRLLYEAGWSCYEQGLFASIEALLVPARDYCLMHEASGGDRLLADIYGGLGSLYSVTNRPQDTFNDFQAEWDCVQRALERGELERPTIWEVFGLGRVGNGLQALHKYAEAEVYYRRCLTVWEDLPGDKKIYTAHLGSCLWLQGKLDEAAATIVPIITDRYDKTNHRTGRALFTLGNVEIAQAEFLLKSGKLDEAEIRFQQASDSHTLSFQNYQSVVGEHNHKTADARHKCAWHAHRRRDYPKAKLLLEQTLETFKMEPAFYKNNIARTSYKLGCVLQDMGQMKEGREKIVEAERLRQEIVPPEHWAPATGEEDFDEIVMFWSR